MDEDKPKDISTGSRYLVAFGESGEVPGIFRGYSAIGNETALVMDSDGTIRYIPVSKVTSVTLLESVAGEVKKKEEPGVNYG